jgi:hypothetical protein
MIKVNSPKSAILAIQEKASQNANDKGDYRFKTFKRLPINNSNYCNNNLSASKLRTAHRFLTKVFKQHKKPYWANVTLFYPPQLPNNDKIIDSCMRSLMSKKGKLASHYIVATEAGIKNNRYHHHVFIYAGSFEHLGKVIKELRTLWGSILHERFKLSLAEHDACDAFNTAHDNELLDFDNAYRKLIHQDTLTALKTRYRVKDIYKGNPMAFDIYDERNRSIENYSKLTWSSYPDFRNVRDNNWKKEAFYHLSYICKMAHPELPERRLRLHPS